MNMTCKSITKKVIGDIISEYQLRSGKKFLTKSKLHNLKERQKWFHIFETWNMINDTHHVIVDGGNGEVKKVCSEILYTKNNIAYVRVRGTFMCFYIHRGVFKVFYFGNVLHGLFSRPELKHEVMQSFGLIIYRREFKLDPKTNIGKYCNVEIK